MYITQDEVIKYPNLYKLNKREYKSVYTRYKNCTALVLCVNSESSTRRVDMVHIDRGVTKLYTYNMSIQRLSLGVSNCKVVIGKHMSLLTAQDLGNETVFYRIRVK